MTIRPARPDDSDGIWAVMEPVVREGATWALPRDMSREAALAYVSAPDRQLFVFEEGGRILGFYFIRANQSGPGSHVANTGYMVAADAGGRGIGRQLCQHSLDEARRQGFRAMQFNFVVSTNERALRLWRAMGFAIAGTMPGAFDHPDFGYVDAHMMYQAL